MTAAEVVAHHAHLVNELIVERLNFMMTVLWLGKVSICTETDLVHPSD